MQKLIALPMARYNNLIENEKNANRQLKDTVKATIKLAENQELLQRQHLYKKAHEEIPETLNKPIKQMAYTWVPPPPIDRIHKRKQLKPKKFLKKEKKPKAKKQKMTKKVVVPSFTSVPSSVPQLGPIKPAFEIKKFDLMNPKNFA